MLSERMNSSAGSPMDAWIPRISALWSAATDDKCQAPSSDEYRDWTLLQLKREIAQRSLKIDQKKRNKDAYVKLLQASDLMQNPVHASEATGVSHIESVDIQRIVNPQGSSQEALTFPIVLPTRTQQPVRRPAPPFPVVIATQHTQPVRPLVALQATQPHQVTPDASPQQLQMHKPTSRTTVSKQALPQSSPPPAVAIVSDEDESDAPVELVPIEGSRCTSLQKRKRASPGESLWQPEVSNKKHEYMGHKLAIKAAKVDIETRRLEMESKRDKHSHELQRVQLELAHEQLKQAKLSTQKIRIEWMIEQTLQKKRLRDAGISEQEIGAII